MIKMNTEAITSKETVYETILYYDYNLIANKLTAIVK